MGFEVPQTRCDSLGLLRSRHQDRVKCARILSGTRLWEKMLGKQSEHNASLTSSKEREGSSGRVSSRAPRKVWRGGLWASLLPEESRVFQEKLALVSLPYLVTGCKQPSGKPGLMQTWQWTSEHSSWGHWSVKFPKGNTVQLPHSSSNPALSLCYRSENVIYLVFLGLWFYQ